ncbi:MAG: TfoX/Sxy family protein [Gemmatimonas sp.]
MPTPKPKPHDAADAKTADRIRDLLAPRVDAVEKKMFGSLAFLVRDKMCICAGKGRLLCRVDAADYGKFSNEAGVSAMVMRGKALPGYLEVPYDHVRTKAQLEKWVKRCLAFNATLGE